METTFYILDPTKSVKRGILLIQTINLLKYPKPEKCQKSAEKNVKSLTLSFLSRRLFWCPVQKTN